MIVNNILIILMSIASNLFSETEAPQLKKRCSQTSLKRPQKRCKICLEYQTKQQFRNKMISACVCRGALKYTHTQCLAQALNRTLLKSYYHNVRAPVLRCQICKAAYEYQCQLSIKLVSCKQFCSRFQDRALFFLLLAALVLVCVAGTILSCQLGLRKQKMSVALFVVVCALALLIVSMIVTKIVSAYCLTMVEQVKTIQSKGEPKMPEVTSTADSLQTIKDILECL